MVKIHDSKLYIVVLNAIYKKSPLRDRSESPEKAYPASHFSAVLRVQKPAGLFSLLFLLKYVCAILPGGNAVFSLRPPVVPAFSEYLR